MIASTGYGGNATRDSYAEHFTVEFCSYLGEFGVMAKRYATFKVAW